MSRRNWLSIAFGKTGDRSSVRQTPPRKRSLSRRISPRSLTRPEAGCSTTTQGEVNLTELHPENVILCNLLHAGMKAMLPVGFVCAILSWRLARTVEPPSDSRDVVEFLLGASAFIMIVLGGIFATY